ncbi:hypothetical protein SAMN05421783_12534 [Thiocapsa roseopersicina]|uniref:Uncharacterized protein n=2 Tax=Thiocapsa roseopersicina TaxID=1058 RepID=A0A1H3BK22_THIRO|nr:hypothetical protein SAMN05421783_12534 [Thiocapsa roseopersicina]
MFGYDSPEQWRMPLARFAETFRLTLLEGAEPLLGAPLQGGQVARSRCREPPDIARRRVRVGGVVILGVPARCAERACPEGCLERVGRRHAGLASAPSYLW